MRVSLPWRGLLAAAVCAVGLGAAASASATPPAATLFVNASPAPAHFWSHGRSGRECATAAYTTIGAAVTAAAPGSRIIVCPGVYHESVIINKQLTLIGQRAVIDARRDAVGQRRADRRPGRVGLDGRGIQDRERQVRGHPRRHRAGRASHDGRHPRDERLAGQRRDDRRQHRWWTTAPGFGSIRRAVLLDAAGAGRLRRDDPSRLGDRLDHRGQRRHRTTPAGSCSPTSSARPPGNIVRDNRTVDNNDDCGITLAGHNPAAVNPATDLPTGAAGVFDNLIEHNVAKDNGVAGQGAGILLGGGAPYAGVYGNVIRRQRRDRQRALGDHDPPAPRRRPQRQRGRAQLPQRRQPRRRHRLRRRAARQTTGVLVASGVPPGPALPPFLVPGPITGTVISGNAIFGENTGIWTLGVDPATTTISGNVFGAGVVTQVSTN